MSLSRIVSATTLAIALTGCSTPSLFERGDSGPAYPVDLSHVRDAVPREEPLSRYGNSSYVVRGRRYHVLASRTGYVARGIASWYGSKFHGRRTSNGERYDMYAMTAAHKSLPLPTYARVTNLRNGRSVVVRINDRGPFHDNRLIDLSYAAAAKLDMLGKGTAHVEVRAIDPQRKPSRPVTRTASLPPPMKNKKRATVAKIRPHPPEHEKKTRDPGLYLQVGSFGNRVNAEQLRKRLEDRLPLGVRILPGGTRQQRVFRVQVGPLASVEKVDTIGQQLSRLGISQMHLILD